MKEFANPVKNRLKQLSQKTNDIFTTASVIFLKKKSKSKTIKVNKLNYDRIISQLPNGIYNNIQTVICTIEQNMKTNQEGATTYSPFVVNHNEFKICKRISYSGGHIITGRDIEIQKILTVLSRKHKRGVILVGEPGVGKTAIVEAINARLIDKNVPKNLLGSEIHNIDLSHIFSTYKDDPMGRIVKALDTASSNDKHILFIDEVHQLLTGKMNDTLKPYLTGKIKFIGSTTIDEYHSIITEDKALERRFTIIDIREPDIEKTVSMLTGTKRTFEDYHKVSIPDDTIKYLVENGSRFMGHRKNPDKALDILDISCTILNRDEVSVVTDIINNGKGFDGLDNNIKSINTMRTVPGNRILTIDYVDKGISAMTGIDYGKIRNSLNFNYVSTKIKSKVFGQDESVDKLSNVVNIIKHINLNRTRPLSIVLTIGAPGTGKATVVKELAELVYGSHESFVDFDLGQFKSDHQLSEIKGAPPGYVGYAKSGKFIKEIRNKPQSIVYFRHANKCNGVILDYLLDAIRKGVMIDSAEKEARLNNCMIVFSITLGSDENKKLSRSGGLGFGKVTINKLGYNEESIKDIVPEELLEIVDTVIMFNKLSEETLERIYDENLETYMTMYKNVSDINTDALKNDVLLKAKNGHDVISGLANKIPKLLFNRKIEQHGNKTNQN